MSGGWLGRPSRPKTDAELDAEDEKSEAVEEQDDGAEEA